LQFGGSGVGNGAGFSPVEKNPGLKKLGIGGKKFGIIWEKGPKTGEKVRQKVRSLEIEG